MRLDWLQSFPDFALNRPTASCSSLCLADSIAYFCQPADDVLLSGLTTDGALAPDSWKEVLRRKNLLGPDGEVEVLTAGEHLRRRLASTYKS